MPSPALEPKEETTTVISPNRPLTRGARDALKEFEILDESSPREAGRQTEVELKNRPPRHILDEHELVIDELPVTAFDTGHHLIRIYPDRVLTDGIEANLAPDEALTQARENDDWEELEVPVESA